MTETLKECACWTLTGWAKRWSWLCLPISSTSRTRQRRIKGPSRDTTCCGIWRTQRLLYSSTGWRKRWWRSRTMWPRPGVIFFLNVSNPHKNSRIQFRGDHFLKAGDTHLSCEVHSRIQEFRPSSFFDCASDHLSANRYCSRHLHDVQDSTSLTDSFDWGYDVPIRLRRARLTSFGHFIRMCHVMSCHGHTDVEGCSVNHHRWRGAQQGRRRRKARRAIVPMNRMFQGSLSVEARVMSLYMFKRREEFSLVIEWTIVSNSATEKFEALEMIRPFAWAKREARLGAGLAVRSSCGVVLVDRSPRHTVMAWDEREIRQMEDFQLFFVLKT